MKKRLLWLCGIACLLGIHLSAAEVERLRCEYLCEPQGIDIKTPRLSWVITSKVRGDRQSAYRIVVASTPEKLRRGEGDLWDSGRIDSDKSSQVEYAGRPL
ncbi:MAG: hypothetical protein PHV49_06530, partial [Alistipes sp.]|nr:hypothetical protein [Alistipes sp.]